MHPAQLLSATVMGDGPRTVVFGNGFATTQQAWDAVVSALPTGWRVLRFDFVGTTPATSPQWITERYATYDGHADDLARLLTAYDVRDAVFVGHSMSGMIGALASMLVPERLAHLLLVGASACYLEDGAYHGGFTASEINTLLDRASGDLAAWMAGFSGRAMGPDAQAHHLHCYVETVRAMRPDIGRTMLHSMFLSDFRQRLADIPARTTVVQSQHDVAVPVTAGRYLAEHTACEGLHLLPVTGHMPHVTHPALLAPLVHRVLEAHAEPPSHRP